MQVSFFFYFCPHSYAAPFIHIDVPFRLNSFCHSAILPTRSVRALRRSAHRHLFAKARIHLPQHGRLRRGVGKSELFTPLINSYLFFLFPPFLTLPSLFPPFATSRPICSFQFFIFFILLRFLFWWEQLNSLGLLPTHASDWVSSLPPRRVRTLT